MSLEINVFVDRKNIPTRLQWQVWIDEAGFKLTLDPTFNPLIGGGFVPCVMDSLTTGFELRLSPSTDLYSMYPHTQGDRKYDSVLSFLWGGSLEECAAATICSASLTGSTDATMYDPQEDFLIRGAEALKYAQQVLVEISGA